MEFTKRCKRTREYSAFTLVELLVVISIISVLVAILIPSLSKARDNAYRLKCATQLNDLGKAFLMYIQTNDGKMPISTLNINPLKPDIVGGGRWPVRIASYYSKAHAKILVEGGFPVLSDDTLATMFRCTTETRKKHIYDAGGTYGYNIFFTWQNMDPALNHRQYVNIVTPGVRPVLACLNSDLEYNGVGGPSNQVGGLHLSGHYPHCLAFKYGYSLRGRQIGSRTSNYGPAPNHRGKCNFLFADWHVESRKVWDPTAWPWFGSWTDGAKGFDGSAFHPLGKKFY